MSRNALLSLFDIQKSISGCRLINMLPGTNLNAHSINSEPAFDLKINTSEIEINIAEFINTT